MKAQAASSPCSSAPWASRPDSILPKDSRGPRSGTERLEVSRLRWAIDDDRPEIVDIGQCRAGHHGITQRPKEAVAIVVVEMITRVQAQRQGARERLWGDHGTRDLLLAVHAV